MPAKSPSDILDQDTPKAPQKNRRGQMADPLQTPTQRGYRSVTVHQDHTAASGTNPTQQSQEVEEQGLTFNAALIKPVASSAISAAKNPRLRGAAPTVKTTHKGPKATIPAKTEQVHVTPYESAQPTPEMKDLLGNPLRLITFLSTQVMECPPAYKRQAMSGTRGTTNADYSLKDTSNQLEMLVYDPNFMEDAAHQLRPKLEQVVLHPSDPWVIAKIGQYHPAFTQQDRCDVVHSEMDIADLVRNVLLRPSLFALRAVKAFQTLSEEPTPKQLCEAIMKDEKLSEFVITSSEPQVIKVPANGEDSVTIDRETATPDLIGSRLEFTDVFNNRVHKRTSILIAELKSVNALRIEDGGRNEKKPTLRNVTTLNQDESYHFTAFRWPGNKGQITRKRDRIICQVRAFPIKHYVTLILTGFFRS
jgi:hypothetical protein